MHQKRVLALFWLLSFLASAAAQSEVLVSVDIEKLQGIVKAAGFTSELVKPGTDDGSVAAEIRITGNLVTWQIQLMGCDARRCADLRFYKGFDIEAPIKADKMDELNRLIGFHLAGNVYPDSDGDPWIQADVNVEGASLMNLRYSIGSFDALVSIMAAEIGFEGDSDTVKQQTEVLKNLEGTGMSVDDIGEIITSIRAESLLDILTEAELRPESKVSGYGATQFKVEKDGVTWFAAVIEEDNVAADNIFFSTPCLAVNGTEGRPANTYEENRRTAQAYNAGRRWITASTCQDGMQGSMPLYLRGGVTLDSIRLMARSFHGWRANFEANLKNPSGE